MRTSTGAASTAARARVAALRRDTQRHVELAAASCVSSDSAFIPGAYLEIEALP